MSTPNLVPMLAPDGTAGYVPADRVNEALKQGGKLGVEMAAPDGTRGVIPRSNLVPALQAGGKVLHDSAQYTTKFEQGKSQDPSLLTDPVNYLHKRVGELNQAEQDEVNKAVGPESEGRSFLNRSGHIVASMLPATAAVVDKTAAGLMDWKAAAAVAAGAVDPAIPAAYFGAQGVMGTAQGAKNIAKNGAQPGNVQDTLLSASTAALAGAGGAGGGGRALDIAKNAPELMKASAAKINPRGALASGMNETPPGEEFSRGEVLQAARDHGVNLDVAQATGNKIAGAVKKANQYSLTGAGQYEANAKSNVAALDQWADKEAGTYAQPADREVVGSTVKKALREDLAERKAQASKAFSDLDENVGDNVINGAPIEEAARKIVDMNSSYYKLHPELKPTKAWAILQDIATRPKIPQNVPGAAGVIDAAGNPVQTGSLKTVTAPTRAFSWSELHNLRSDLMDFYRNNPDIVKGRGEAWIQQMVSKIDQSMTDSANNGLSPDELQKFRDANNTWESMKQIYDNPQSPLYHAVRAPFDSQVPSMLTQGAKPELVRQVHGILGDDLYGSLQRKFVESLINDKNGNLDLGKLDNKISRVPNDYLEETLGTDGARNLKLLGKVARTVKADANPSGTAKVGVPASELAGLFTHPPAAVGEMAAQFGAAKAMHSPRFIDYLLDRH